MTTPGCDRRYSQGVASTCGSPAGPAVGRSRKKDPRARYIRALVSIEMILSDDYLTPTIAGQLYFNKPPVYNWLTVIFYSISGNYSDVTLRMVTIFSLICYGLIIYLFNRKYFGNKNAIIISLMLITCGRILFYDSFYGLIDITYSALVYLGFMLIWRYFKQEKYLFLFVSSYILTGITFLMKGLPSLYYQGITLLVIFIGARKLRVLFSWKHLVGIILLALIIGGYYSVYLLKNPGNLENILRTLYVESSQKTALGVGIVRAVKHFFTFPFEVIYHFLPWTIFIVYFFRKDIKSSIRTNPFVQFNLYLFFFNILVYWLSPDTYARYLFVHAPLLFTVLVYLHSLNEKENTLHYRMLNVILMIFGFMLAFVPVLYPILDVTRDVASHPLIRSMVLILLIVALIWVYMRSKSQRILLIMAILLVSRIGFNWFILTSREKTDGKSICRDEAIAVGRATKGKRFYFVWGTPMVNHSVYYITRERLKQVEWTNDLSHPEAYYVIYEPEFKGPAYEQYYQFHLRTGMIPVSVVKFK